MNPSENMKAKTPRGLVAVLGLFVLVLAVNDVIFLRMCLKVGRAADMLAPAEQVSKTPAKTPGANGEQHELMLELMTELGKQYWAAGDLQQAFKWISRAAEKGHPVAQRRLGLMYDFGEGVPENSGEAVGWYIKAAEQGQAEAQFSLGMKFLQGDGVAANREMAVNWFKLAANQGVAEAQSVLGQFSSTGEGMEKDLVESYKWFILAETNIAASCVTESTNTLAARMTPEQIAEAHRRADAFVPARIGPADF